MLLPIMSLLVAGTLAIVQSSDGYALQLKIAGVEKAWA